MLVEGGLKIKSAPSENWREVIELWQCHNENYDQFIDSDTRQIVVPDEISLANFNYIRLSKEICLKSDTKIPNIKP